MSIISAGAVEVFGRRAGASDVGKPCAALPGSGQQQTSVSDPSGAR